MRFVLSMFLILLAQCQQQDFEEQFLKSSILSSMMELQDVQELKNDVICGVCKLAMKQVQSFTQVQLLNFIKREFAIICPKLKSLNFCDGIRDSFFDQFASHFFTHYLNPQNACARLDACEFSYTVQQLSEYVDDVLSDQLSAEQRELWSNEAEQKIQNKKPYTILHLADLHVDVEYQVGMNAFCEDPFCCREENGLPKDSSKGAEYWGTHAPCDMPMRTVQNMIEFAQRELKPDIIIWTGDSTSHDVWHQQQHNQTLPTKLITEQIQAIMPDTQVYAIFGNHEAYPADQYDVVGQQSQWLRSETSEMWDQYLDSQAKESLKVRGFYSQVDKVRNVKFIAMNTQACDALNFFLFDHITDPMGHLEWLRQELQQSEDQHQHAIIFAHIPPGDSTCHNQWSERFTVLIERYQHVVKTLLYGHTHRDHIQIIRSLRDLSFITTAFIAPSGTTFSYQNPSFRIFEMDTNNNVKDYVQYRLNLQKANQDGPTAKLEWNIAYRFLNEYGLKNMSIQEIGRLPQLLNNDEKLLERFVYHYWAGSDVMYGKQIKNLKNIIYRDGTKRNYICGIQSGTFDQWYRCVGLIEKTKDTNFILFRILGAMAGINGVMRKLELHQIIKIHILSNNEYESTSEFTIQIEFNRRLFRYRLIKMVSILNFNGLRKPFVSIKKTAKESKQIKRMIDYGSYSTEITFMKRSQRTQDSLKEEIRSLVLESEVMPFEEIPIRRQTFHSPSITQIDRVTLPSLVFDDDDDEYIQSNVNVSVKYKLGFNHEKPSHPKPQTIVNQVRILKESLKLPHKPKPKINVQSQNIQKFVNQMDINRKHNQEILESHKNRPVTQYQTSYQIQSILYFMLIMIFFVFLLI